LIGESTWALPPGLTSIFRPESTRALALIQWHAVLRDDPALIAKPGTHHKLLLTSAHALHHDNIINDDDLSDLLELADGALAFAVEAMIENDSNE
jgi:hypothetical protein